MKDILLVLNGRNIYIRNNIDRFVTARDSEFSFTINSVRPCIISKRVLFKLLLHSSLKD